MSPGRLRYQIKKYRRRHSFDGETHAIEMFAIAVGVTGTQIYRYLSGETPVPESRIAKFCTVLECSPLDLFSVEWLSLYEGMLSEVEEMIFENDDAFAEKSSEMRGWSRELRQWRRFFTQGGAMEEDVEASDAQKTLEETLEEAMMPEGSGDPVDDI